MKPDDGWLPMAAKEICEMMKLCQTGVNRIKKAASSFSDVEFVGNKTGGLGGIANDTAFIRFDDNHCAILTIFTAYSPLSLAERENVIAESVRT